MFNQKSKNIFLYLVLWLLIIFPTASPLAKSIENPCDSISDSMQSGVEGFSLEDTFSFEGHPVFKYRHKKSGARVVIEKNNDINKKFEIIVRTPPENNKGANHIIEHCVLNGSREYPCKNMIWELSKSAHSTYINALTYPSYTAYAVASTDEDELESLAKIYTSGVFHPLFLEDEKIFRKEGIRYELNEKGDLQANGTVFNEMRQNSTILEGLIKRIFPDTQGRNVSGGLPEDIMDLSHSELCDTYKKYYHPSNTIIYLTGDINYKKFLKWIEKDYLSDYKKEDAAPVNYLHQSCENLKKYDSMPYYKKNTDKNLTNVSLSYLINPEFYKENSENFNTILSVINSPNSPQNKFLKEKGYLSIDASIVDIFYDPIIMVNLYTDNSALTSRDIIEKTVDELFNKYPITQCEIDQVLNRWDFKESLEQHTELYENRIKSSEFAMSFVRFEDPCSPNHFFIDKEKNISLYSSKNISEQSIKDTLASAFREDNQIITVFYPSDDLKLTCSAKINEKLKSKEPFKEKLTENYRDQKQWAESPNSPENLNSVKSMFKKLSDIKTPDFKCPLSVTSHDGHKYYQSFQEIGDFISCKFIFKINHLSDDDKKYCDILLNSFYSNNTKNNSREELEKRKSGKSTISLSFKLEEDANGEKNAFLILTSVSQKNNIEETVKFLKEQVNNIDFKDKNALKEFLKIKTLLYDTTSKPLLKFQDIVITKNLYEKNFFNANQSEEKRAEFYKEFYSNIDNDKFLNDFSQKANKIKDKIFNQNSLEGIGICASQHSQETTKSNLQDFIKSLSNKKVNSNVNLSFSLPTKESVAFVESGWPNNAAMCMINSKELSNDINFNSTCSLLNNLLLMPVIREKNGAYGAFIQSLAENDTVLMSSYQDPNISATINEFKAIPEFIKNYNFSDEEIENTSKSFLGSLFINNKLTMAELQIEKAICKKIDHCELLNKNIQKIKNISQKEIKNHGEILEKLMSNIRIYALLGEIKEKDKKLFDLLVE